MSTETNKENIYQSIARMQFDGNYRFVCGNGNQLSPMVAYNSTSKGWVLLHRWRGDRDPIRYTAPVVGWAKRPTTKVNTFANLPPENDSVYWHLIEKVGPLGAWIWSDSQFIKWAVTNTTDVYKGVVPNTPVSVKLEQSTNHIILSWFYSDWEEQSPTNAFRIYLESGGIFSVVDTVSLQPGKMEYRWTSPPLTAGLYIYSIKAVDNSGVESLAPSVGSSQSGFQTGTITDIKIPTSATMAINVTDPVVPEAPVFV